MIGKIKNRYLLVEATRPIRLDHEGREELNRRLISVLGELSFTSVNPRVITQLDERTFVLKAIRSTEGNLILSLTFISEFNGNPIRFYTLKTSGTVSALSKSYKKSTLTKAIKGLSNNKLPYS